MATGGSPSKGSSSDSHTRSGWQSTSDDAVSMNSILNELRPNNLEVSEWKDSTLESSKRRKKGNRERERERGQSLLHDVQSERRQHTPSTYPRTKLHPNSQIGEKIELENLRRHISFDGFDEISTDDEKNNDRYMSSSNRREMPTNHTRRRQDMSSTSYQSRQCLTANSCKQKEKKRNQNNANDTCDESGMENDDYDDDDDDDDDEGNGDKEVQVKQKSRNNKIKDRTQEAITDSNQIVARLMQIKDYLKQVKLMMDTLEQSDDPSDHRKVSKLAQVMSSLQEQEKSYMEILQKLWVIRRHAMMNSKSYHDEISKPESPEGSDSLDFEEKSQASDTSMPNFEPSLVGARDNMVSMQHHQLLLKQIIEQKEQLKLLQQRQEALLTIEKDAVRKLAEAREKQMFLEQQTMESLPSPTSEMVAYCPDNQLTENGLLDDFSDSAKTQQNNIPLANQHPEEKFPPNDVAVVNEEINSDRFHETISHGRLSLQNKLQHLQEKRKYVDELLNYVKTLHVQHREQLQPMNNDSERTESSAYALQSAELAAEKLDCQNQSELNLEESSSKWEELQGMRERLNHLCSLFQQCQNNAGPNIVEAKDQSTDKEATKKSHDTKHVKCSTVESYDRFSEPNNIPNQSDIEDEDLAIELGSLMHQPEVQDKFNELREAKERLRHLQDLIGKLNENCEQPTSIETTEELIDAMSRTNGPTSLIWQPVNPSRDAEADKDTTFDQEGAEASVDQLLPLQSKSVEIKLKMQEQLLEVERLKEQRKKLLSFHQQLLKFHDSLPNWNDRAEKSERDKISEVTFAPEPLVQEMGQIAYSSNDELYNKMRKERIQREELRQKKKEMEDLMHKDKPKRHYSRNQDNQSDSVSYSTDFLGANASADITMATWGGSTADNLESINEDCDRQEDEGEENGDEDDDNENDCNDDDDYASDDIIQIEEEECAESSSKETYTIEKDAQHHHVAREYQSSPLRGLSRSKNTFQNRNKCRYFGLQNEARMDSRHNIYNRETLSERFSHKQPKQENIRAAEYIIQEDECDGSMHSASSPLNTLERQMDRMTMTYQELLAEQQLLRQQLYLMKFQNGNSATFETPQNHYWQPNLIMSPLESQNPASQQQMLLALNQCFQHLSIQQAEMNSLQRQIHNLNLSFQSAKNVSPVNISNQASSTPGTNQWSNKSNQFSWDPNFQSSAHCTDTLTGSLLNSTSIQKSKKKGNNILSASFSSSKNKKLTNPSPAVEFRLSKQNPKKCSKDCNQTCSYYWNFTGAEKCTGKSDPHVQYKRQPDSVRQKYSSNSPEYTLMENSKRKSKSFPEMNSDISKSRVSNLSTQSNQKQSSKSSELKGKNFASTWLSKENITTPCQSVSESAKQEGAEEAINFDNLKSDIYAEVAKLISQNEKHPKYLICLFQKLQYLTSDCMRQCALQSLLNIIGGGGEQENEEQGFSMYSENLRSFLHPKTKFDDAKKVQTKSEKSKQCKSVKDKKNTSFNGQEFNYEGLADVPSPSVDNHFANDSHKGTAINLKKVLHSLDAPQKIECKNVSNDIEYCNSCSSAMDQGSESSISDMTSQKVDGLTLNDQIKSTVNQLLPFLKLHKDQVFSAKLLTEMRQKIFFLLCQPGINLNINCSKLNNMLETALSEFECQSVRNSYQNVLAKVSEIIYNEIAYVRLIEDLGDDSISKKTLSKFGIIETVDKDHPTEEEFKSAMAIPNAQHAVDEHLSLRNPSFEYYKLPNGIQCDSKTDYESLKNQQMLNGVSSNTDRDEAHLQSPAMKIELAVSETKPFSRIGSDEDDEDYEESHTAEDPSITAVSLAVEKESCLSAEKEDGDIHPQNKHSPSLDNETNTSGTPHSPPLNCSIINTASSPTVFNHQYPQGNSKVESESLLIGVEDLPNRLHALNNSELEESAHEQCTPIAAFFDNLINGTEVAGDGETVPANKFENSANLDSTKDDIEQ